MISLSPTQINEETTHTFTLTDGNNGPNFYYHFYIDSTDTGTNSADYGTITSFNGLTKQFTFEQSTNIDFSNAANNPFTQTISYNLYNDYPTVVSYTTHTITFIINDVNNPPSAYIKIIDNTTNSTIYVDSSGVVDTTAEQNFTLKADISGITDTDIGGNAITSGTGGAYQWWKSTNSIVNALTISNYDSYTTIEGETAQTLLLIQDYVGFFLYVTYKYNDGSNDNIAYSGKTSAIANVQDAPTGNFCITNSVNGSSAIIDTELYKHFIVGQTDGTLYVNNTIEDIDVSSTSTVANTENITKGYKWYRGATQIVSATNSNYTIDDNDKDTQINVQYEYTDSYGDVTTIEYGATADRQAKTPTILKAFVLTATIDTAYSHILSTTEILDADGTSLDISLDYVSGSNNTWLRISKTSNIYTLFGTPIDTNTVGPNQFTLQFTRSGTVAYTFTFIINVNALSVAPTLISISGDMSRVQTNGVRIIEHTVKNFTSNSITTENSTFGPIQSSKVVTNTLLVSDTNIYYNSVNSKYESTTMKLTFTSSPPWLSYTLNSTETVTLNNALGITTENISGDSTNGYYFSIDTAPNTNITTPYKWVFDISGTPPDTNLQTYTINTTLSDVTPSGQGTSDVSFTFKLIVESFRYFLPNNISTPVQGEQFEKFIFVTSSKSQNNISMIVKQKPSWMKIQLLSTLDGLDIPTGIISMESIDISSPSVCNPHGPFDIVVELRDGSGLVIEFSNGTIDENKKIGNYSTDDFLWMYLNRPDQRLLAPRVTAYPCFICSDVDVNGDCTDTTSHTFTKYQLDMRRKVETLKYKDKTFGYSKAMITSQYARAKQGKKKQWAAQSITNSYPNVNNYTQNGFVLSCPNVSASTPVHIASQSNVPGNKSFPMFLETNVPVVNYVPVRRTYRSAAEKYPQFAYKSGDLGFPVGKSGRTPTKTPFVTIIFSVSGITKTNLASNRINIEEIYKLLFLGKRTGNGLLLESIVGNSTDFYSSSQLFSGNAYTFTIKLIDREFSNIRKLISTLFVNQIITIFNKFLFLNIGQDYRRLCSKIISISGSDNFVTTINSLLSEQCESNKNSIDVTAITDTNIHAAVNLWVTDPINAEDTYGHIIGWNTSAITDMSNLFQNKTTFDDDITSWNVSNVKYMSKMFSGAIAFNQDIGDWTVTSVIDMSYMFSGATAFNQNIGNWSTSLVENMSNMFSGATAFNQNIGEKTVSANGTVPEYTAWNTSAVTNMSNMFSGATVFNQDIGDWTVSAVTNMSYMFSGATAFNQNIGNWSTSLVENMSNMFSGATAFNQNIGKKTVAATETVPEYTAWNTSLVTNMSYMFSGATAFNQDIGDWTVSAVTTFNGMFNYATVFDQDISNWQNNISDAATVLSVYTYDSLINNTDNSPDQFNFETNITQENIQSAVNAWFTNNTIADATYGNISVWDTSAITDMHDLFKNRTTFNDDISKWNTSLVTNMSNMFEGATSFNQDISTKTVAATETVPEYTAWNTSLVTNMSYMFSGATAFNKNIGNWNTSSVTNMSNMFSGATTFNQNIRYWSIISVTDMTNMLNGATAFAAVYSSISGYDGGNPTSVFFLFRPLTNQELINAVNAWTYRIEWQTVPGYASWSGGTTTNNTVTSTNHTHGSESRIKFNYSSTTAFSLSFDYDVSAETYWDYFTLFQTKNGGSTQRIFSTQYTSNNQHVAGTYNSGTLSSGTYIFEFSYYKDGSVHVGNDEVVVSNINISGRSRVYNDIPIANWNTSMITDMSDLFKNNITFNDDISAWNTSIVTNMSDMFRGTAAFNVDISSWNVSAVTNMSNMFNGATTFNKPIGIWTVSAVTNMMGMFYHANVFNQNIGDWNTSRATNMSLMFSGATAFNQNIGDWNTLRATNMSYMFNYAPAFDQNITRWNTNSVSVSNYLNMFNGATAMIENKSADATPTSSYFNKVSSITQSNIVAAVTQWLSDPTNATNTYGHIKNWNTSAITDMHELFQNKTTFNDDISDWNVSAVTNMSNMFNGATAFDQNISEWTVTSVTNYTDIFTNCSISESNKPTFQ